MADAVAPTPFPTFTIGDRMAKARVDCGIRSTKRMAELLNPHLDPQVKPSTVSAWERGVNQPTRGTNRMAVVVPLWAQVCTEEARRLGIDRQVSAAWLWTGESTSVRKANRTLRALPSMKDGRYTSSANRPPLLTSVD